MDQPNLNAPTRAKNKAVKKREDIKYNPDETVGDSKHATSGKRFKSAPKILISYITGREQYDSMVKYLPQKPVISIESYNMRMSGIYDQIGKLSTPDASADDITKINHFNNYMRRVDVDLVYEDDK
ncbi:hypothetical protein F-E9_60 [Faustovirus]|nr:hypothetical protein F-E9_60 [Faustovirus]